MPNKEPAMGAKALFFALSVMMSLNTISLPINAQTNPFDGVAAPQELLIVAPAEFLPALQPLIQHKRAIGISAFPVSIESLSFISASDDPERIKKAIQYAYEHLSSKYVMLMGDASRVPVRYEMIFGVGGGFTDGQYWPSDLYYANLYHHQVAVWWGIPISVIPGSYDNWDANRDGFYNEVDWNHPVPNPDNVDGYPDVAVGRIPAHTVADVSGYVQKIIRYETQPSYGPALTFLADAGYPQGDHFSDQVIANSSAGGYLINRFRVNVSSSSPAPASGWSDPVLGTVAASTNISSWVSYIGHGWQQGWDDPHTDYVSGTASNNALPVVVSTGCSTGAFAPHPTGLDEGYSEYASGLNDYLDTSGKDWNFTLTNLGWSLWNNGSGPGFKAGDTGPMIFDHVSGQSWGNDCFGCAGGMPMATPKPAAYDRKDRSAFGYSYPWLIKYPHGGAIAYFGEVGVTYPSMAMELETDMLSNYFGGDKTLGSIYLRAERQYWFSHYSDTAIQSQARIYLGWMVFFGDPSLQVKTPGRLFF